LPVGSCWQCESRDEAGTAQQMQDLPKKKDLGSRASKIMFGASYDGESANLAASIARLQLCPLKNGARCEVEARTAGYGSWLLLLEAIVSSRSLHKQGTLAVWRRRKAGGKEGGKAKLTSYSTVDACLFGGRMDE
jgi:hypothetical protein